MFWSEQMFRLLRLDPARDHASFRRLRAALHPDDRSRVAKLILIALKKGEPIRFQCRIVLPSQRVRCIDTAGDTVRDLNGNPVLLSGISIDDTEHGGRGRTA